MKHRLKIFLSKHSKTNKLAISDLIKYDSDEIFYPKELTLEDEEKTVLYYKQRDPKSPGWYTNYLGMNDELIQVAYGEAMFFRTIVFGDEEYLFAVTFNGSDSFLAKEKFEQRFGMKLALNIAKNIYAVSKSNISSTQSKVRENATRGQEFSEFTFDIERDLLNGVVVYPQEDTGFTVGKICGKDCVSFTTTYGFDELNELLEKCVEVYKKDTYRNDYAFIDNILEVPVQDPITSIVYDEIYKAYIENDFSKIWFAPAEFIDWEEVNDYGFYRSRITDKTILHIESELDTDTVRNFIKSENIIIENIEQLKKYHVIVRDDNENELDVWKLFNCVYASVEVNGIQYVLNNGGLYKIDIEFFNEYEKKYRKLYTLEPLKTSKKNQKESEYNEYVCAENPERFTLLDQKNVNYKNRKFEVCDVFDNEQMTFIHVKKYGQSSVLSHLFAQANISATLLKDQEFRTKIIEKMKQQKNLAIYNDLSYLNCSIAIAIISNKEIPGDGFIEIPFFSKVNAVKTINMITSNLGYKNVKLMFIPTEN